MYIFHVDSLFTFVILYVDDVILMSRVVAEDVNKLKQHNHTENTKDNKMCHKQICCKSAHKLGQQLWYKDPHMGWRTGAAKRLNWSKDKRHPHQLQRFISEAAVKVTVKEVRKGISPGQDGILKESFVKFSLGVI